MATPVFNSKSPSIKRIMQESRELSRCPDPSLTAAPLESNLFEWHFTLRGPPSSVYEQGIYHGRIVLPPSYPLRPPAFRFLTPSGRFETNREICLSISGHHEETWQPAWGIRTALCAIRAFMAGDAKGQVGGLDMHPQARERLARESRNWKCPVCARSNEEIINETEATWKERGEDLKKEEIPDELRLAFREELEGKKDKSEDEEKMEGREGEQKDTTDAASTATRPISPPTGAKSPPPTRTPPTAQTSPSPRSLATRPVPSTVTRQSNAVSTTTEPLPKWIDAAIVGVAVALLLMIMRRWAGMGEEEY